MRFRIVLATSLFLALFKAGYAQTLDPSSVAGLWRVDKAKLDQFFDRLAEKNQAMGSLTIAKDGNVVYTRAIGYAQVDATAKKPLTEASRFRLDASHWGPTLATATSARTPARSAPVASLSRR